MTSSRATRLAATLPLVTIPTMTTVLVQQFGAVPDFVRGLVTGASLALLLGFCLYAGTVLGVSRHTADARRLDDLDPLGDLPREQDGRR
ncbi:hypothetical protein [Gryllotalpicola koreensis]|uniref:Uncharacterized protein n=1 Tax=Gryllotalpicola koreensis TaxID=993086 RepID=A0ABP7ZYA7_9MICO